MSNVERTVYSLDKLSSLLSEANLARLREYSTLSDAEKKKTPEIFEVDVTSKDKDERRLIHKFIAECLPDFSSETTERGETKLITFGFSQHKRTRKLQNSYLYFVLRKRNWDTMQALNKIAKCLRKKTGDFFFAGTKDKRAQTVQRVVAKTTTKEELAALILSKNWNREEISVCSLHYTDELLKIGQLQGNRFTIALRFLDPPSDDDVQKNCENLQREGFLNYFGLQRFGSKNTVDLKASHE